VFGSYAVVDYNSNATANICRVGGISHVPVVGSGYTCNPDFNISQLGVVTRWTPVKNLTFSAEVQWFHLDQKFSGLAAFAANGPKPAAVYEFKDQDAFSLNVRAQRNF
jgi:Porin subfamily